MRRLDGSSLLSAIDVKIAETENPRHLKMLRTWRAHAACEVDGDLDGIMDTLVDEPRYSFFGSGIGDFGPKGGEAVRAYYKSIFVKGYNKLDRDRPRIVMDDHTIFCDGILHMEWPGKALQAIGVAVDDADATYLYSYQSAAIFKFDDDGNCVGEDSYGDGVPDLARITKIAG